MHLTHIPNLPIPFNHTRRLVRRPVHAYCAGNPSHKDRSTAALGAVDLPHGVLWWNDKSHSVYQHDLLHGQDFTLQRQRPGGPGLVLARQISSVQIVDQKERQRVSIQAYQTQAANQSAPLAISDMFTFDVTDYALVEDVSRQPTVQHYPPTECTGMVLVEQDQAQHRQQV